MTQLLEAEVAAPQPFDDLHSLLAYSLQWNKVADDQERPGYRTLWAFVPDAGFLTEEVVIVMVQFERPANGKAGQGRYALTRRPVEDNRPEDTQAAVDRLLRAFD